jgi:hypothetical protein
MLYKLIFPAFLSKPFLYLLIIALKIQQFLSPCQTLKIMNTGRKFMSIADLFFVQKTTFYCVRACQIVVKPAWCFIVKWFEAYTQSLARWMGYTVCTGQVVVAVA